MRCAPLTAVLVASALVALGCAPWSEKRSRDYVTVQTDHRHDTKAAQRHYRAARRHMDCHLRGQWCDLSEAEDDLREALAADVRFGPAHHSLGVLYFWQKKLYLAAWEFEYTNRLMPDRFEPLNNLGLVYESAGKFDEAIMFYSLAREKAPEHPDVIGNLARVSYRSGQSVDEMRPLLEDVLATDTRPEWRHWAGELLGLHPPATQETSSPTLAPSVDGEPPAVPTGDRPPTEEELPLIAPPAPSASAADAPLAQGSPQLEVPDASLDIELGTVLQDHSAF